MRKSVRPFRFDLSVGLLVVLQACSGGTINTPLNPHPTTETHGQSGGGTPGDGSRAGGATSTGGKPSANSDSDCDGLSDEEEGVLVFVNNMKTDPANPDTDGDGILDGVEHGRTGSADSRCMFDGDKDPTSTTSPTSPDTDADGLRDGIEDANHNGARDLTETDPARADTDFDALDDGVEDSNHDGVLDANETDPRSKDTDNDFISDATEVLVGMTNPRLADTDADTCNDGIEDTNHNGIYEPALGEKDPKTPGDCNVASSLDTDNDGLPNALEVTTDPNNPDTDGDGVIDGVEDKNKNGSFDPGETDPTRKDTDCDGLLDGPTSGNVLGEDANGNGKVDTSDTDPLKQDTDGDGVDDGVERGVTMTTAADTTHCPNTNFDADAQTTTDPTKSDSDADAVSDGAEDANQNGRVDTGELDPGNGADVVGPASKVCTAQNLRPIVFVTEGETDIQLGVASTFTESAQIKLSNVGKGIIGYDGTHKVAFVAWRQAAPAAATNPTDDEAAIRPTIAKQGALSNMLAQTFTSWDGLPATLTSYQQAGSADLKVQMNALANDLVGAGAGTLVGNAGVTGPFQIQLQILHQSNASVAFVVAMTPVSNFSGAPLFVIRDTAGGSALAPVAATHSVQCEQFMPVTSKGEFLFGVDDSSSMGASQNALASAATAMTQTLNNTTLDWRIALVTSSYHLDTGTPNFNIVRGFVSKNSANALATFQSWLVQEPRCTEPVNPRCTDPNAPNYCAGTQNGWIGTCGAGAESVLGAARGAINHLGAAPLGGQTKFRPDAKVVVVLFGDADDQTTSSTTANRDCDGGAMNPACEPIANFNNYFNNTGTAPISANPLGMKILVHGVICPSGQNCNNETQKKPQRNGQVITATGGTRGAINNEATISSSINAIVVNTITAFGYKASKPVIGSSIKVALDGVLDSTACNANDIPRNAQNGFSFSGVNRTFSFFGACRPASPTSKAAVSYRYWRR